jgi:hypothetical protein
MSPHGAKTQKKDITLLTAVKTSNLFEKSLLVEVWGDMSG